MGGEGGERLSRSLDLDRGMEEDGGGRGGEARLIWCLEEGGGGNGGDGL